MNIKIQNQRKRKILHVMRMVRIYALNFHIKYVAVFIIVIMYIPFFVLIFLITETLYLLTTFIQSTLPLVNTNVTSFLWVSLLSITDLLYFVSSVVIQYFRTIHDDHDWSSYHCTNIILLTIFPTLYISYQRLIYFATGTLYNLPSPFLPPPLWQPSVCSLCLFLLCYIFVF